MQEGNREGTRKEKGAPNAGWRLKRLKIQPRLRGSFCERHDFLGYVLTVLEYASYCAGRFFTKKGLIFASDLASGVFAALSSVCFNSYTAIGITFVMIARSVFLLIREHRKTRKWLNIALFILLFLLLALNLALSFDGLPSILLTLYAATALTAAWWFTPQGIRGTGIAASPVYAGYCLSIGNPVGVMLEAVSLASNIASFLVNRRKSPGKAGATR